MATPLRSKADLPLLLGGSFVDAEKVLAELYPGISRFAAAISPSDVDPQDLVQEAFVRVLRNGNIAVIDNLPAYLKRAVLNQLSNHNRTAHRRRRAITRMRGGHTAGTTMSYPSDVRALLNLEPLDRAILYLSAVDGWTFAEIASMVEMREATVRGRASRARAELREQLQETMQEDSDVHH